MSTNIAFFAWNRPIPGRERISAEHFQQFVQYAEGLKKTATIQSYDAAFLDSHGGDMNGFFLIRADGTKLDALLSSLEWVTHMTRASLHLERAGTVRGVTGALLAERMALWTNTIPAE